MNMKKKIIIVAVFIVFMFLGSHLYASDFLNAVFNQASNFRNISDLSNSTTNSVGSELANFIEGGTGTINIIDTIFDVGNIVIFVMTIVLGLKYIYSGIEGRADIKESLPNYVLGVVFFYLAVAVRDLSKEFMSKALGGGDSYTTFAGNVYATVSTIANVCAILGIVLVGLKYMLSPADTRADVKKQLLPVAIGIVFVYCTLKIIMLVYNIGQGVFNV